MRKGSFIVALAVLVLVGIGTVGASASGIAPAKKRCHFVKKKVNGKIKRVRVCTKPKPKPKPKVKNVSISVGAPHSLRVDATGTTYDDTSKPELQLAIPQGALASPTQIVVSRVTAVRGLPKGLKLVAGVQLEPENLALEKPATLVVKASGANLHAIAWFGRGRSVSRHPSSRVAGGIEIKVAHFSGVAVVQGAGWTGFQDATAALRARFSAEIKPRLAAAANEDPLTSGTFEAAFAWERQVQLLGLGEVFAAEWDQIVDALEKSLVAAIGRSETACKSGHDLTQIERLTKLGRVAGLWGIQVPGDDAFQRAVECAHFELDIEFQTFLHGESSGDGVQLTEDGELVVRVERVPIAPALGTTLTGSAPLQVAKWDFTYSFTMPGMSCSGQEASATPTKPLAVTLSIDPVAPANSALLVDPGDIDAVVQVTCPTGSSTEKVLDYSPLWRGAFADKAQADGRLRFVLGPPLGQVVGGTVWATYGPETKSSEFAWVYGSVTATETVRFTLRHTPQA